MPEKLNNKIVENYALYKEVRFEEKTLTKSEILLKENKNQATSKVAHVVVESEVVDDLLLIIRANKINVQYYGLKLMSKTISDKPFFRFDASGLAHFNRAPETPLSLCQITTPHFQYYDEQGYNTAYKNAKLKNLKIVEKLEKDINVGTEIFCRECFVCTKDNAYPTVIRDGESLFETKEKDPLKNIDFDE